MDIGTNTIELIKRNNLDKLGRYYFSKAFEFSLNKEFEKAFEFLKFGILYTTCDCKECYKFDDKILNKEFFKNHNLYNKEFFFVKAFLLSFSDTKSDLDEAISSIESYILISNDFWGKLLKAKILITLKFFDKSIHILKELDSKYKSSKVSYYLGKLLEDEFNIFGLDKIFKSFKINPSSTCCLNALSQYHSKHNRDLILPEQENILLDVFLSRKDLAVIFNNYLNNEFVNIDKKESTQYTQYEEIKFKNIIENLDLTKFNSNKIKRLERYKYLSFKKRKLTRKERIEKFNLRKHIFEDEKWDKRFDYKPPVEVIETLPIINEFNRIILTNINSFNNHSNLTTTDNKLAEHNSLKNDFSYYDNPFYNDSLDLDQQNPEFWDNL
ncbi:hypothetical protein [uncultured Tenacibaculum sp.]|uniref:hypothetical protein n=1 Tax=uncultured Tenacibaculum sp. TaxID=174713 RepID=UPI00261C7039|nr:hypothetical protein [uncultured Tenacibaculum sp.]